jgi:hypothetical protein
MTRCGAAVLLLALLPGAAAGAATPYWGYGQYEQTWAQVQADEKGRGSSGLLSVPLTEALYVVATGYELDAWFTDPAVPVTERYTGGSVALGLHGTRRTRAQAFGTLGYFTRERRKRDTTGERTEHTDGGFLTVGAHWLIAPWLSVEPEGGIGYSGHYNFDGIFHLQLGVRVLPRVWLVGGYHQDRGSFLASNYHWSAGLRLAWRDSAPPRPAGAKPLRGDADGSAASGWRPGETLQAQRALKLQARPLAGAPEIADVPIGALIVLQKSARNEFGTWWRVTVGADEGWIRESQLR